MKAAVKAHACNKRRKRALVVAVPSMAEVTGRDPLWWSDSTCWEDGSSSVSERQIINTHR